MTSEQKHGSDPKLTHLGLSSFIAIAIAAIGTLSIVCWWLVADDATTTPVMDHSMHMPMGGEPSHGFFNHLLELYTPRRVCMFYETPVIWLHLVSDLLIAAAYYSIPIALVYFVRRRKDVVFGSMFWLFAAFILACGTTHIFGAIDLWAPYYKIDGVVKLITAFLSVATAIVLWPLIPRALALPGKGDLEKQVADQTAALRSTNEALRDSEERFRLMANSIPQLAWMAHADGSIFWYNDRWYEYTGTTFEEMQGWGWQSVHDATALPGVLEKWRAALAKGERWEDTFPLRRNDGQMRMHLSRALALKDKNGNVQLWFGTNTDIEDQLSRDRLYDETRQRLELSVNAAEIGTFYCPMPLGRIEWNDRCKEHFFLPPDAEITFETFYARLHPEDRERVRQAVEKSVYEFAPYDIEYRTHSPDGQSRWIRAKGRAYYDAEQKPLRFDGVTVDISEQKQSESLLRDREVALREAQRLARIGSWRWNRETDETVVSDELRHIFGISADAAFPKFQDQDGGLYPHESWVKLNDAVQDTLRTGEGYALELEAFCGEKSIWILTRSEVVRDDSGKTVGLRGTIQDTTETHQMARERESLLVAERHARSEAERASQLKDEFLATVSHELRTPLNAILGWSQIVKRTDAAPDVLEGMAVIERNARIQVQLIEDLLDMSRIISGKLRIDVQRVELPQVVRAAVEAVKPAADAKEIRLESVLDEHVGPLRGDPARLQQVVWNLLSNAIKFTSKGGKVQIALERVNSHVEITVSDNGIGIGSDFLPHVFERFRQADGSTTRTHGGLGIGLAIVKSVVEAHGGRVFVKSPGEGQGSTFSVHLPLMVLHEESPDVLRRHPRNAADDMSGTICREQSLEDIQVLVVDDEQDARDLIRRVLEECHASVEVAGDADTAIQAVKRLRPAVIVSDIGMPGQDGYAFIRAVRELSDADGGTTPAVALTAFARSEDRQRALLAGYQSHIAKPVEPSELITVVASLAGRIGLLRRSSKSDPR